MILPPVPHSRPLLGDRERAAVLATIEEAWVGAGGDVSATFSGQLAEALGRPAACPVSSGTAALEIALRVLGAEGRLVATPAFSCASIERAIVRAGAIPRLIDVDPQDLSLPVECLEAVSAECPVIMLVHQFGLPAGSAPAIKEISSSTVVEDVTTVVGATLAGRRVGAFGDLTMLSLSATKMVCAGEGGGLAGEADLVERARQWLDPECELPFDAPVSNAKLSAMACALGGVQLERLPELLTRRRQVARAYDEVLGGWREQVFRSRPGTEGSWWRYLVDVTPRDPQRIVERANAEGVRFARPVSERRWAARGRFPVSDALYHGIVSVPIHPSLSDAEVERVSATLSRLVGV